ncbi:MAG TPA: hypothetical protein PKL15_11750 [Saprospiraceae bacterium]|nr:hypothetical protein [Saprospiraceae bacterium]
MSKKRFSEGLDDLFKDLTPEATAITTESTRSGERRHHGKNFVTDLDALLQEALDESLEKYEASSPSISGNKSKSTAAGHRSGLTGIDALIRQTIDLQELTTDENTGKRRLTVVVDRTKLDKLKTIARLENSYLKDLLVGLIDEYIKEYVRDKGVDL